jgi:hypothetical protein
MVKVCVSQTKDHEWRYNGDILSCDTITVINQGSALKIGGIAEWLLSSPISSNHIGQIVVSLSKRLYTQYWVGPGSDSIVSMTLKLPTQSHWNTFYILYSYDIQPPCSILNTCQYFLV